MTSLPREGAGLNEPGPEQLVGLHVWVEEDEKINLPVGLDSQFKALSADQPAPHERELVGAHCWIQNDETLPSPSNSIFGSDQGSKPTEIPLHQLVGINVWIENHEELLTTEHQHQSHRKT
jgi:hypothetical protein